MSELTQQPDAAWPVGWEGHERAQLLYLARLPLAAKLRWLEEAQAVVEHLTRRRTQAPGHAAREAPGERESE